MEEEMTITISVAETVPTEVGASAFAVFADLSVPSGRVLSSGAEARGFSGAIAETLVESDPSGRLLIAVGIGARDRVLDREDLRRIGAAVAVAAKRSLSLAIDVTGLAVRGLGIADVVRAVGEGAGLASYNFDTFKSEPTKDRLARVLLVTTDEGAEVGAAQASAVVQAVALCRDLVNTPAGDLSPRAFAKVAARVAEEAGLGIEVFKASRIRQERMGGLLGVAAGSAEPPRFVRLSYVPEGADDAPTVALVGKGITFDSGGLSIKPANSMMTMKDDMSGAAAVLATMSACASLAVKVHVIGYMPLTENMPGDAATRPGDVLRVRNGKTIEVLNTDAEGRLVLADALSLAVEASPDAIIDLATLTGACVVALGKEIAGLLGNDDDLIAAVEGASVRAGEPLWQLPIPSGYRDHIESDVADMKNIGATGQAGSLSAALLLQEFVSTVPWVHLDIAGPAFSEKQKHYVKKGGTGFGVRTLLELLSDYTALGRPASGEAKGIRVLR